MKIASLEEKIKTLEGFTDLENSDNGDQTPILNSSNFETVMPRKKRRKLAKSNKKSQIFDLLAGSKSSSENCIQCKICGGEI